MNNLELPTEYTDAKDDYQKATACLIIAGRKQSRVPAWDWANRAAGHAEKVGISNARALLGINNYPDVSALRAALATLRKDALLIVTRHRGLVEWLNIRGYTGKVIPRATPSDVLNMHVIGKLPMHLCAISSSVTNVYIPNLPESRWGDDLTADEMERLGAYMRTYVIKEIPTLEP